MKLNTRKIAPEEIQIDTKTIARLIGADPENIPEPYDKIIEKELFEIKNYRDIEGGYGIVSDIQLVENSNCLIANDIIFEIGKQVYQYLKHSDEVAFFICSAGRLVSERYKKLMNDGQVLEGYINDVIGSTMVERAMDIIHQDIRHEMENKKLKVSNRYSPGYCEWDVSDQHQLFRLFPENFCGVTLSDSSLMQPVKSISGVIGIGENVKFHKYVCQACTSVHCIYRNVRHTV